MATPVKSYFPLGKAIGKVMFHVSMSPWCVVCLCMCVGFAPCWTTVPEVCFHFNFFCCTGVVGGSTQVSGVMEIKVFRCVTEVKKEEHEGSEELRSCNCFALQERVIL